MARYVREEVLNQPDDFVNYMMNDFLIDVSAYF